MRLVSGDADAFNWPVHVTGLQWIRPGSGCFNSALCDVVFSSTSLQHSGFMGSAGMYIKGFVTGGAVGTEGAC